MKLIQKKFKILDSTQDYARAHLHETSPHICFLYTADAQTHARATQKRIWVAPANVNVYATYTMHIPLSQRYLLFNLPQVVGYSVAQILESIGFEKVELKWVNDVLINRKKVCGILCESEQSHEPNLTAVFIGIGLNVNMEKKDCDRISQPATSLKIECGKVLDKNKILNQITEQLLKNIKILLQQGFVFFQAEIEKRLAFKNEVIHFKTEQHTIKGVLKGIDEQGMLLIECNHQIEKFFSGSIF